MWLVLDMRATSAGERCFACGRKLGKSAGLADTRDAQVVHVGRECLKLIRSAGESGYQPPRGGPRLFPMPADKRK